MPISSSKMKGLVESSTGLWMTLRRCKDLTLGCETKHVSYLPTTETLPQQLEVHFVDPSWYSPEMIKDELSTLSLFRR